MDLSNLETHRKVENSLNEDQHAWLNTILKKQVGQFNEQKKRIYLVQFVNSYLKIEYLIRPLPYGATNQLTGGCVIYSQKINKIPYTAGNSNVCITPLENSPKKDKKAIKKVNNSY
ncbi:unnamed protein product [Rhizophagus irregularis]|nr:unnamed protein product [Rhizophagus irregularis]